MRLRLRRTATAFLFAVGLGLGATLFRGDVNLKAQPAPVHSRASGGFAPTPAQWAGLTLATVTSADFTQAVVSDGVVATDDTQTTPVLSPFSGRVTRVFVNAGQVVRQGAPLFTLAGSELVQAHADLRSATAARAAAAEALRVAQIARDRQARLLAGDAAAKRDLQQAEVDLANARSSFTTADANLGGVRGRLNVLGAPADGGNADGTATVRAPVSGTVIARTLGPGQYVQSVAAGATTALLTISNLGRVYLTANLREADAARVHVGDAVVATVAALPGREFHGRIETVGATVDPATRRIGARATVANLVGLLRPGMFATMRLAGATTGPRPSVPEAAIVYEGDAAHVWIAAPDHTLSIRAVRTGQVDNARVEVLSGLSPGERVVTAGAVFIDRAARPE